MGRDTKHNGLLPVGTIDTREVEEADVVPSKRGMPIVRLRFREDGFLYLGPFDYYAACKACGQIPRDADGSFDLTNPWSVYRFLPSDPCFLTGRSVTFVVGHIEREGVTYQSFRFKGVAGQ